MPFLAARCRGVSPKRVFHAIVTAINSMNCKYKFFEATVIVSAGLGATEGNGISTSGKYTCGLKDGAGINGAGGVSIELVGIFGPAGISVTGY